MQELNLGGVFVPMEFLWAALAFLLCTLVCRRLDGTRIYQLVWHRALFEFALFVILWGGLSALGCHLAFSGGGLV